MDFLELCKKRFSTRKFSAQKIDEQKLEHIMECVRMAPSAVNRQPWSLLSSVLNQQKRKLCNVTTGNGFVRLHFMSFA